MKNKKVKLHENDILYIAGYVGKMILEYGGETYRAEDMVDKICRYYGLETNSFAVLTSIMTSVRGKEQKFYTSIEKINVRTINVEKISKINNLVHEINKYSFEEFLILIKKIDKEKTYSFIYILIGNCLAAGAFAFFFKGDIRDCISSFIGGALISLLCFYGNKLQINNFFINLVGGILSSISAFFFYKVGLIHNVSISIISTLMLLVPGIAFTNSIRDLIAGDLVSGISRGVEAFMVGTALAIGSGLSLSIIKTMGGL
ncbi:threonine/serine ThrE exporter family protein [Cetobacterium sp. SF1]|uniref:threonine/serine ThrE exporter family protein n=1 Tax=Cetobacterium sp. SF1 TaxID=3417654 RepID=UPI003CEA9E51